MDGENVYIVNLATGKRGYVPRAELDTWAKAGYQPEEAGATEQARLQEEYGDSPVQTAAEGFVGTATGGLSDLALSQLDEEGLRERRARNRGAALVGEVAGALVPVGFGGLAGAAGHAAEGVAGAALGEGIGARVLAAGARGVGEGAVLGAGQGVSELATSKDPITAESVVADIGGNALYGAAFGGAAGTAGGLLSEAATAGKNAIQRWAETPTAAAGDASAAAAAPAAAGPELSPEVAAMDKPAARAARQTEVEQLGAARAAEAKGPVYQAAREFDDELGKSFVQGDDPRLKRIMQKTRGAIRNSLDSAENFAKYKGSRTADALNTQAQAIDEFVAKEFTAKSLPVPDDVQGLLAKNNALRARIGEIAAPPASPRLAELDAHLDALATPPPAAPPKSPIQGFAEKAGGGAGASLGYAIGGPIGGAIGYGIGSKAAAAVLEGGLGAKLAGGVERSRAMIADAASSFASGVAKVGDVAAKAAPALSTAVLSRASFAPADFTPTRAPAPSSNPLVTAYKARETELRSQTTMGPNGTPVMSGAARDALHQRLHGLWVVNPKLADMAEAAAAVRLEFLASKLPARPDSQVLRFGPDKWHPGDMEMRKFARYVDATEDVNGIFDRLANGKMKPEDAEVLRDVYPATMDEAKKQIVGHLTELRETLPYRKRLMLSMLFDVPVEASFEPAMFDMLQSTFTQEPGTDGGMSAPKANLGSIKKSAPDPTAAQRLATAT